MTIYVLVTILGLWVLILSIVVWRTLRHYRQLVTVTGRDKLDGVLDVLLQREKNNEQHITALQEQADRLEKESQTHIQKIGFIRFNPFDRVGGENSFTLALLNNKDTGIVVNFLYTRDGVRIYAKRVIEGKGQEYDLSTEEKEAIKKAN